MTRTAAPTLLVLALALTTCAEPLEFAAWTLTVPERTPVIEYADVPDDERSGWIELQPDLVLGDEPDDPAEAFYGYPISRFADDGAIFVLDSDNHRVQVFSAAGEHVETLGGEGQGPEELFRPTTLEVTDDRVVVNDSGNSRYSIWRLDGKHVEIVRAAVSSRSVGAPIEFHSLGNGSFVGRRATYGPGRERGHRVSRFALAGGEEETFVYAERPHAARLQSRDGAQAVGVIATTLTYATGPEGAVYLTDGARYQVLAYGPTSELHWALRVARTPAPYPAADIEARLERLQARSPGVARSDFDWPETLPTLGDIAVDAAGRLYVFPWVRVDADHPPPERRPVDVYAPDGERILAGWVRGAGRRLWTDAHGDHVVATDWDYDEQEWHVVRYRLVTPFE